MKKKVYIILIVIMALVIILTAILLIMNLNGKDSGETDASPSPSISASSSPSPTPSAETTVSPSPSESIPPSDEELLVREETPDGILYTISPEAELVYRVTINEPILEYIGNLDGQTFASLEDGSEYLKISFIPDAAPAEIAPSFLNSIIAFTEFDQSGQETVRGTQITGEKIAANDGVTQVEAWLIETDAGVLAVVISYTLSKKDLQTAQLDEALSTFEIKLEDAEDWAVINEPQTGW